MMIKKVIQKIGIYCFHKELTSISDHDFRTRIRNRKDGASDQLPLTHPTGKDFA